VFTYLVGPDYGIGRQLSDISAKFRGAFNNNAFSSIEILLIIF